MLLCFVVIRPASQRWFFLLSWMTHEYRVHKRLQFSLSGKCTKSEQNVTPYKKRTCIFYALSNTDLPRRNCVGVLSNKNIQRMSVGGLLQSVISHVTDPRDVAWRQLLMEKAITSNMAYEKTSLISLVRSFFHLIWLWKKCVHKISIYLCNCIAAHFFLFFIFIFFLLYLRTADEADAYMFYSLFFVFFCFFSVRQKIPDNRSRERLNGFSWNFYQTIAGKM